MSDVAPETAAAAAALVAEVERLFALAVYYDPETQVYRGPIRMSAKPELPPRSTWAPWAILARDGYGETEIGIDAWETTMREAAESGEISWETWLSWGQGLVATLTSRLELEQHPPEARWGALVDAFWHSVKQDVENAGDKGLDLLGWVPWVVGGVAVIVGGLLLWEIARTFRTAGNEFRLTAQEAGTAARRKLNP